MASSDDSGKHSKLKLISESFIRPNPDLASNHPHYLGPIDFIMLSLDHMQKGLLFHSKPLLVASFLDNLKHSLSLCLAHFHPLAGRLATEKYLQEHASWIYVDCTKGPGARLLHASVDLTVSDVLSPVDLHPVVRSFFDLDEKAVNHDGHIRPLLSIQVTELLDGMFIGFTMNHSVADGTSLWHFISTLSEIFLQIESGQNEETISISKEPIYGPFFLDGSGPIFKLPYLEPKEFVSRFEPGPLRERIFHFSPTAMAKLKRQAQAQSNSHKISSYQALCALFWRCVTKARNLDPNEETTWTISATARPRINPPFPDSHFGNLLIPAHASCKAGELVGHDLGWSAMMVHRGIMDQDDKAVREFVNSFVKAPWVGQTGSETAYYKPNSVLLAGSPRFDMYGPEFGLGRAVAVLAGYANKDDGKATANPGREGKGSVDLEVCLKPNIMNALELDDEFMSFVSSN